MTRSKLIVATLGLAMCAPLAMGQDNAPGGAGREGGRQRGEGQGQGQWGGGGERPNFEQMRERMNQQLKEDLKATDEEWQAIQPAMEKVQRLQMQTRGGFGWAGGRRGGPGGPGGAGGPGADMQSNPVSEASRNLQQALEDQNTSPEVLKQRLDALRAAREKARTELTTAQGELRELLTVRQEAVLVSRGTLE